MEIRSTMCPGEKGTRRLLKAYGEQLVCVRYRYDRARGKRYTTVELIVDEQEWQPGQTFAPERRVLVQIGYGEGELREQVKAAGGWWNAEKKGWVLAWRTVLEMGLERRVISDDLGL